MFVEKLIDLTHPMKNGMAVWPGHPVFEALAVSSFAAGDIACNHALHMSEHSGTHFDAPAHFIPGGQTIDEVPLQRFFGRLVVIDARDVTPDSAVAPGLVTAFEALHGQVQPDDAVLFHFGWGRFWDHPTEADNFLSDWPGLSGEAADLLIGRRVRIVGSDAMSIDRFGSTDFPAHRRLLAAGVLIGENFANLDLLPPICRMTTLPLRIAGGTGSPLRAVAHIDQTAAT